MSRIILFLSCFAIVLGAVTIAVGLSLDDVAGAAQGTGDVGRELQTLQRRMVKTSEDRDRIEQLRADSAALAATRQLADIHRLLGIATALGIVLVDSIAVTYFVGTARWCKEVVAAYRLPQEFADRTARLKRRTFAWSLASMFAVVAIVAAGGAADPIIGMRSGTGEWATLHLITAVGGMCLVAWVFFIQYTNIAENFAAINAVMQKVKDTRASLGLETEPAPV